MELPPLLFLAALSVMLTVSCPQLAASTPHTNFTDHESLLAFRDHVTDPNGILATNWTTNTSFCSWIGITCSRRRQRVIAIRLFDRSLQGILSPRIGNLSFLSYLSLANNTLTGPIPQELAQLHRLTYFNLSHNYLSGHIPSVIFNMSSVIKFSVALNNLWGSVPSNHSLINMLPRLQKISLSLNNFSGDIAVSFAQCRHLEILSLAGNQFSGTIPAEIGSLPELAFLYLGGNQLTGPIPSSLGNLTKLIELDLMRNNLGGIIPKELGNLQNLKYFSLTKCNIAGSIPTTLLNDSMLQVLDFSQNKLSGFVPVEIGKSLQQLQIIFLNGNQLTGGFEFLSSLSNCRNLSKFVVLRNKLEGVLPDSVGNLSMNLQYFVVDENHIIGSIPAALGNLSGLITLSLGKNELTGTIPSALTRLYSLQYLDLYDNRISGVIPFELGLMKSLNILALQYNLFFGPIPDSLANMSMIQGLYLDHNNLSSSIPQSLWTLESLLELDLSVNTLSGSLSPQVRSLKHLNYLNLSTNQLSGKTPGALGDLQMLTILDLSKNSFQGEIPENFGGLISITNLNLSHNFLSGVIPNSLANLTFLDSLDLSFNKLEGKIPNGRVFSNLRIPFLIGNEALCGAPQLHLPPCTENDINEGSTRKLKVLKYAPPLVVFLVIFLTCIYLIYAFYWRKKVSTLANIDAKSLDDHRFISHQELIRATTNFNAANLLGRGSFSSVFRGCLDDGLLVAVKVLNLEVEGALKSFEEECQVLRMVRHRNLIKIISVCSNLDFKALVLEFMPKGNLEQWLHSDSYFLNLLQRLNIMVDVSAALEYLHHHHPHVVLHCDLKPTNILLDEEMVAHVSDFGIAKLLLGDSRSIASASTMGTIGYMAPEYTSTGTLSRMGDVYSFGILLLETFTGRKPVDVMFDGNSNLREWVWKAHSDAILDVIDCNLQNDLSSGDGALLDPTILHCLMSIIELGLLCSNYSPKERIPMTDVAARLHKIKIKYLSNSPT